MTKIFIFNSPPNSGKDVLAEAVHSKLASDGVKSSIKSFKERLIEITLAVYGVSEVEWRLLYTREGKETPYWKLRNSKRGEWLTPRQALIHISEEVIKPQYGKDYFGRALADSITTEDGVVLIPDGGFVEEVIPLIDKFGKDNVYRVSIIREGCDFNNDSRKHLPDCLFSDTIEIVNDSSLENFLSNGVSIISKYIGENDG